ncbi:hypothetical protein VTK73DRAFT_1029 [Phialemonium thermophilum]|uniref:Uncharacterized protein n=1 Tax=Phialemonium thermophilum TaxID=223376 RepID=A0ABR3VU19_9PEZI
MVRFALPGLSSSLSLSLSLVLGHPGELDIADRNVDWVLETRPLCSSSLDLSRSTGGPWAFCGNPYIIGAESLGNTTIILEDTTGRLCELVGPVHGRQGPVSRLALLSHTFLCISFYCFYRLGSIYKVAQGGPWVTGERRARPARHIQRPRTTDTAAAPIRSVATHLVVPKTTPSRVLAVDAQRNAGQRQDHAQHGLCVECT